MARRNPLRSLLSMALIIGSATAGVFAAPMSASAAEFVPDHIVRVHPTYFEGPFGGQPGQQTTIYAKSGETIEFRLVDPGDIHHTVTLEISCDGQSDRLCERAFDVDPPVIYRFFRLGEFPFYDRYAREEGRPEMTGKFVITDSPPPIPPSTTTTTLPPSTTSTTRPVTTTTTAPSTTTSTAPTQVRPFVIPDPTTSTTAPAAIPVVVTGGGAPPTTAGKDKGKDNKDKAKSKAAEAETPTTVAPAPTDVVTPDAVFDPAALTPSPVIVPDTPGVPTTDDINIESSAIANLLDEKDEPADHRLWLLAFGGLAFLLLVGGTWTWFHRASVYDPA